MEKKMETTIYGLGFVWSSMGFRDITPTMENQMEGTVHMKWKPAFYILGQSPLQQYSSYAVNRAFVYLQSSLVVTIIGWGIDPNLIYHIRGKGSGLFLFSFRA